ncbi:hypothetical protein Tco_0875083 [Tanacetum coccineum]|uniref:Uncharacterized protein n=1 Tax=Tanacetum coccineum TaxID=301880 RepID=A0ABQ5BRH0_9ASTR
MSQSSYDSPLKGKEIVDITAQIPSANTIVPGMFKELLVYVRDTCPNAIKLNKKKVAVTPKNKVKKVRFAEPLTSSSNIKQVESSTTSDSNTHVLSPTRLKCSTSNCGSKPTCNKKNDRISRTPSRNMKNKVEDQPRKVNKKNSVVEPIHDVDVKYSLLKANSEPICANCKKSMFGGVHDMCLLDFVENVNSCAKSAKKHKKQNIWKPTGHVFTEVGLKWKPTGRTFTIVGLSKKDKIVESKNANHSEPNHIWGSNATDIPSSSSLFMTGYPDCSLVSGLWLFETYDKEPLSAHELSCALGKSKKSSHQPKAEDTNQEKLYLLHMDLCGPMSVVSINGKRDDWDHLFQPMFDEYFNPPSIAVSPVPIVAGPRAAVLADSPVSTSIDQDTPSTSIPSTQEQEHYLNISQGFEESPKTPTFCDDPLHESLHEDSTSQGSSSNVRQTH